MVRERKATRAIVVAPDRAILLLYTQPREGRGFWMTPGGGLEPGESDEQGLRRELREETGLEELTLGPLLARRHLFFGSGERRTLQTEHIYLVEHERFEPVMHDQKEARYVTAFRWWPLAELETTEERIAPRTLPQIV